MSWESLKEKTWFGGWLFWVFEMRLKIRFVRVRMKNREEERNGDDEWGVK
jgi:hypothetical protein